MRKLVVGFTLGALLLVLGAGWITRRQVAFDLPPRLSEEARAAAVAPLRGTLEGRPLAVPDHPELTRRLPHGGPVFVSLWHDGKRAAFVEGRGETVAAALTDAAAALAQAPALSVLDAEALRRSRLQVDVVVARGLYLTEPRVLATFGLAPGLDGLGVSVAGTEHFLLPDELVYRRLLLADQPIPLIEFNIGLDFLHADAELARRANLGPGNYGAARRRYFRFRTDSFVEAPPGATGAAPLPLTRTLPPGPEPTAESLLAGARAGGRYLMAHLDDAGRYVYEVDLATGAATDPSNLGGPYSLPRHAGATYYLGELYGKTRDAEVKEAIERAIGHMSDLVRRSGCHGLSPDGEPFMCLAGVGENIANMGSTALGVVAIAEYRRHTGDTRFDDMHRAMLEWILMMQKPNGQFAHLYDVVNKTRNDEVHLLYFDGEAALALVRSYHIFGDPELLTAAERAIDATMDFYDFFAGQFFFGEEHWTCIASAAAWPALKKDRYREFCSDYARFLRAQQYREGEGAAGPDFHGAYGATPFVVPHNTPAGSRTEAMISAYELTLWHGRPDEEIRQQILRALSYVLRQQVREENAFWIAAENPIGAMPASTIDRTVRIDYVQHTCSAMLRAIPYLERS